MYKSRFPGKPLGRSHSARKRISTGKLLKGRSCKNEAGTSGIYEADNIRRGLINFTDFCGLSDSDEVRFLIIRQCAKSTSYVLFINLGYPW